MEKLKNYWITSIHFQIKDDMKVNSADNYLTKQNFSGKLIVPENMSEMGKQFVDRYGERIIRIIEPEQGDMFLHEIPINKSGDKKIVLVYNQETEPKTPTKIVLNEIIAEFNRRVDLSKIKIEFDRLLNMRESVKVLKEEPVKQKPYVPLKIGKLQKPFIKRKKYY